MTNPNPTPTEYRFDKNLAAHIVYAEVKHSAHTEPPTGRSVEEVQTLTRRISWLVDKDLLWTDIDDLISMVHHHPAGLESFLDYLRFNIDMALGTIAPRLELAA